jgi:hypothetical protein
MNPTKEQVEAVDLSVKGALRVNAYAGTGKTSTLKLIAAAAEVRNQRGLYLAFNKSIATEAATQFVSSVACKTTHSLAFGAMIRPFNNNMEKMTGSINAISVANTLRLQPVTVVGMARPFTDREMGAIVLNTVRRYCHSADRDIGQHHIARDGILEALDRAAMSSLAERVLPAAQKLWQQMADPISATPCGHDGYLKAWALRRPRINADYVMLDEAQDSNPVILEVLAQAAVKTIYVGDRFQQIYSFRGAVNAMDTVQTPNTSYLTQSWRFGPNIARFATDIIGHLGAPKPLLGNPGIIDALRVLGDDRGGQQDKETVAVLCRTNAELISEYVYLLSKHKRPHIVGGTAEIERLLQDAERLQSGERATSPEFLGFSNWDELTTFVNSQITKSPLKSFVKLVDDHGCRELLNAVKVATKSEAETNYVLSTAHKAKGREWDRVRLGTDFRVDGEEEGELGAPDELRLFYVACTRAKTALGVPREYVMAIEAANNAHQEAASA